MRRVTHTASPKRLIHPPLARAAGERGVALASRISGEPALPISGRLAVLSQERLCRHVLVCGATGSGKTETVLRLAWGIAKTTGARVFYLDGKGDRQTAERFCALMADAGRETRVFPIEQFDGWRGEAHEIQGRLMEIVDFASEGPASWYRDLAKTVLALTCEHPQGPPRSSGELLLRMDHRLLSQAHPGSSAVTALRADQVAQVRLRYEAFFGATRSALDGSWSWDETQAAYVLLDSLALREETTGLARFLFEDFAHYFTRRKPREEFCVMIVDEFSALAARTGMATRVEQARGFHTSLVLAPQIVAGMGEEAEIARILGSVETIICHRVNTPDEIVALAGTRRRMELTTELSPQEQATGQSAGTRPRQRPRPATRRMVRSREEGKIDPNEVRSLPSGKAFIISRGRAMKAQILTAPDVRTALPHPTSSPPPPPPSDRARTPETPAAPTVAAVPASSDHRGESLPF
jgi:hypothetical protein